MCVEKYISAAQAAKEWGISTRRVYALAAQGRIPGATQLSRSWAIPKDATKPTDARLKNGNYIGYRKKLKK
ncbi:MAG: helix-turn-helix domain-containing protein [Oscillospiraceae bacterium]